MIYTCFYPRLSAMLGTSDLYSPNSNMIISFGCRISLLNPHCKATKLTIRDPSRHFRPQAYSRLYVFHPDIPQAMVGGNHIPRTAPLQKQRVALYKAGQAAPPSADALQ